MSQTLEFHPLTFVADRDGVTVGRPDTESYAVLPADGAELLRHLADGMSVTAAADWYLATFGERIDMTDFTTTLADLGFLRAAGEEPATAPPVRYRKLGRALFSAPAWICYAAIIVAACVAMAAHPRLRPGPQLVFFSSSLILVQIVLTVVQMPAMCLHEWFHVMAGRRLGLPTKLSTGRRFYFFVFETHLSGLLGVPKRKRYLPFLAGILADLVAFCGLVLIAAAASPTDSSWLARVALAVAFTVLLRLGWQGLIFIRTDPYYALTTWLGCTNLTGASSAYLRHRLGRLAGLHRLAGLLRLARRGPGGPSWTDEEAWSPRDRAMARWFALISVVGCGGLLVLLGLAVVPVGVSFTSRLVSGLIHGTLGDAQFWDATVTAAVLAVQVAVLPLLAGRRGQQSIDSSAHSEVSA